MPSSACFNMRAIAFLCLLGLSVAQTPAITYPWDPFGSNDPNTESHVCLTDQASCGCCLMQKQMDKMEMFFNMSLNELQSGLQETQIALDHVRASRSAFSVALTDERWCLGPFRDDSTVVYKYIFINLGEGYNDTTGIFTVPRSGVYSLSLTVYSDAGGPNSSLAACAQLVVKDVVVAMARDRNLQDQEDSATISLVMHLNAGDKVRIKLPIGCFLCDGNSHYNTFTGFLLYATD